MMKLLYAFGAGLFGMLLFADVLFPLFRVPLSETHPDAVGVLAWTVDGLIFVAFFFAALRIPLGNLISGAAFLVIGAILATLHFWK